MLITTSISFSPSLSLAVSLSLDLSLSLSLPPSLSSILTNHRNRPYNLIPRPYIESSHSILKLDPAWIQGIQGNGLIYGSWWGDGPRMTRSMTDQQFLCDVSQQFCLVGRGSQQPLVLLNGFSKQQGFRSFLRSLLHGFGVHFSSHTWWGIRRSECMSRC